MGQQANSQNINDDLISLNNTLNKDEGIVNTSSAHRFLNQPEDIEAEYEEYARTHALQSDIESFISALTDSLADPEMEKSVPGYIVGPYGFGKTSTAGKVWYILEKENNYIATPPIYFDELQSIVDGVYGWMRYRLRDRPEFLEELERVYEAKASNNIEEILDQTDIDNKDSFKDEFEGLIESGSIDIEFSVTHVLDFLSECNQIAKEAGYDGLVVIADELQQFVSNHSSNEKAYSDLRDLAKSIALGLNEGDGLGLLFTMDDGQHSDLDVNADDVLARLRAQNVKLNLSNVYGRSFPDDLWEDLGETFGFKDDRYDIISKDALDAIGQICERGPPLSNGPRTVVDLFTIAIEHYLSEGDTFDALDLADAYYTGQVRFKGDHIKKAITEGINSEIINSPDRENFIKLCGVFPRGISEDQLKQYEVFSAKEDVKSELHGQIIITHEEGRTLKRLERDSEDRGLKDELFTQFYRDYDTTDTYHSNAAKVFRERLLTEEIFPAKRGKSMSSWVTKHEFEPETGNAHTAIFRGSFDGQSYPERIIEIRTGTTKEVVKSSKDSYDVDMVFGFVYNVEKEKEVTPYIERPEENEAILHLDFTDEFDSLPSNLALLEDYMSPEDVNPHLLMSLYDYMISWEENNTINPNQEDQLEYIRDQLINRSVQKLFGPPINNDSLISEGESSRRSTQPEKVVPEIFNKVIQEIYPDYTTLYISDNYVTFLEDYESLLIGNDPNLRISQKRGNTPIEGTKQEISSALGVSSNATAESRLDKQFKTLIEKEVWSGQDARIRLKTHPLEDLLKEALEERESDALSYDEAYDIASRSGYRPEEVDWALRLLEGRDYIERNQEDESVELSDIAIDYGEVQERYEALSGRADEINSLAADWERYDEVKNELTQINEELESASNEDIEILDGILARLREIDSKCNTKEKSIHAKYLERARNKKEDLQEFKAASQPRDLNKTAEGSNVPFAMHLNDIQTGLESRFQKLELRAEEAEEKLRTEIKKCQTPSVESIETLIEAIEVAESEESDIEQDIEDIEKESSDYANWCSLASTMGETRSEMIKYRDSHEDTERVEGIISELDQHLQDIQTEFQQDGDSILRDAGIYREEFEDIQEEFEDITAADEKDFLYRKNVLENTLREGTNGHPTIRQNLNPNNAQRSRNDLEHEFERQIKENEGGIDDIQEDIESLRNSLRYAELLNQIPSDPDQPPEKMREEMDEIEQDIESILQAISQLDVKEDIQLPDRGEQEESFPNTDQSLRLPIDGEEQNIGESLEQVRTQIAEISEAVKEWRQTRDSPPEGLQDLMDELDYRERKDLEDVITTLAEKQGHVELGEFFDDLQELFEDNHVSIRLKSEHR